MGADFTKSELRILKKLKTPTKIQDYLEALDMNFEINGDTCMSPRRVMREGRAHCMEGAMFAATALRVHGYQPFVMDLEATARDYDHVVALFQKYGKWGALSKTNHSVLRYRDPIYASPREIVMSYFHEYFDDDGKKNLRSYSRPVNLARFDNKNWMTAEEDIWYIPEYLADIPHIRLLTQRATHTLRRADPVELEATDAVSQKPPKKKK